MHTRTLYMLSTTYKGVVIRVCKIICYFILSNIYSTFKPRQELLCGTEVSCQLACISTLGWGWYITRLTWREP